MVSRCCKSDVHCLVDYYICSMCLFPCRLSLSLVSDKEDIHDSRNENQIEIAFDQT